MRKLLAAAALAVMTSTAGAQTFPSRQITLVVPFPPGGVTDPFARVVGPKVTESIGQPIIIENKPGANSTLGVGVAARSAPDGYTFVSVLAAYSANMSLYSRLSYKPSDLAPVAEMAELPLFLFASKKVPVQAAPVAAPALDHRCKATTASATSACARRAASASVSIARYRGS